MRDCRIVVIDDEIVYLELVSEFVNTLNLKCLTFEGWADTTLHKIFPTDLVFVDLTLPDIDGVDIVMKLSEANFLGGIVIMSGADESIINTVKSLVSSVNLNLVGFLHKPFQLKDIERVITDYSIKRSLEVIENIPIEPIKIQYDDLDRYFDKRWVYPVYQPQIDALTNTVVGLECLSRMEHPEHGVVSPERLITSLEKENLIDLYTLKLVERAMAECQELLKANNLVFSFNVSSLSLTTAFTTDLIEILGNYPVSPKDITIEITETSAISLNAEAQYAISKFRLFGLTVSLDDFGTGYSSISQLHELPFNEIKVDRCFISEITTDTKAQAIVNATQQLASKLGYNLIIEGVETVQQRDYLVSSGCHIIQGYYYSKPLIFQELLKFLKNSTKCLN